jgi:hydrogenase expression/formation protein HypC
VIELCLAIPVRLVEVKEGATGFFEIEGVRNEVDLSLIEDAAAGDYVLVHAGFAIEKLDEEDALRTLAMFEEIARETEKFIREQEN